MIVVISCDDVEAFAQGLRNLTLETDDAARKAQYQKLTTEATHELMLELQDDSCVAPAITAYYRASAAQTFRDEATAAFRRRLGGALKDILSSIEYDRLMSLNKY